MIYCRAMRLSSYVIESKKTIRLAIPLMLAQVGQILIHLVDAMMVGRLGVTPVAAGGFASNLVNFPMIIGLGLCTSVQILVAQSFGRKDLEKSFSVLKHGIWSACAYALILAFVIIPILPLFYKFGQPAHVVAEAEGYVVLLVWSILPILFYQCLRNFYDAQNRAWIPFAVFSIGFILNVILNWLLIYGNWGFPQMGLNGAGVSTFFSRLAMALILLGLLFYHFPILKTKSLRKLVDFHYPTLLNILALGIPTGLQIMASFGFIAFGTIMIGWLGAPSIAANHIALQWIALVFMVPLGLSFATTIRIGAAYGKESVNEIYMISRSSLINAALFMAVFAMITFTFRYAIPRIFISETEVIAIAAQLLMVAALSQVLDGIQINAMGALRGLSDVNVPTVIVYFTSWVIGFPACYFLAFKFHFGAIGIWLGLLIGIASSAILLSSRLNWNVKRVSELAAVDS